MIHQSLFESFNARALEPEQIGRGFIYSPPFAEVAARSNSIVLGPRGSGKTTLLKMLTLPALRSWWKRERTKETQRLMEQMDFIAIYVPSDFTWYPDFRRPIKTQPPKDTDDLLSYALFRSHVLLAICDTLGYMIDPLLKDDRYLSKLAISSDEVLAERASGLLAASWGLEPPIGGFYGLRSAVTQRIRAIQHLLTLVSMKALSASEMLDRHAFLSATFFDDLKEFGDVFEHVYSRRQRWAACFDELEIAPDPVKVPVWQSGRSFDSRFLIKISASPYDESLTELLQPKMPMASHDFREIDLSSQPRREIDRFSRRMFQKLCSEIGTNPIQAEQRLGPSFYDDSFDPDVDGPATDSVTTLASSVSRGKGARLAPNGFYNKKFRSLARKDPSFEQYLVARGIDPNGMEKLPEFQKASLIRKIISTVIVRDEFLFERAQNDEARSRRYRARKVISPIYTGAYSLFALCEGNPRWIIGMFRPLIAELTGAKDKLAMKAVGRAEQSKRIERTITTFLTLLSTLRAPSGDYPSKSIIELVEQLGDFSFEQVLSKDFNPEPVLSFTIDRSVTHEVQSAVGRAINQGALVIVPQSTARRGTSELNSAAPGTISGKRVRLAFLLAPRYRLPLVLGRSIDLSPVLRSATLTKPSSEQLILGDLFLPTDRS
ncbi:hypothetical protein [Bradyrhizobium sp. th.b2]|uniref:ORC-CDC6 family AAA ATPase n=1 Tax=Bradyrhizobium sp. th-b2 TaxID=172088 RepID=UPI00040D13CC|nr:hypothetical protein [Bradyrhizobium sp. th.b2]